MSECTVKTIYCASVSSVAFDEGLATFDKELEEYLNDGFKIVGSIRSVANNSYESHFVTLKKDRQIETQVKTRQIVDPAKSKEIQKKIRLADLRQWQLAEKLGINESMFSRKMREGITESEFLEFSKAIDEICGGTND